MNALDVLLCERPRPRSVLTKLEDVVPSCTSCKEARAGELGLQGSVGSRLVGFEKDRNSLSDTQPHTCWIICDSVPVCVAVDRLRPCTSAELLAFHYRQTKGSSPLAADARTQQGCIDERAPLNPTFGHRLSIQMRTKVSETMECQSQHQKRGQKSEKRIRRTKQQNSYGHPCGRFVTREFMKTF